MVAKRVGQSASQPPSYIQVLLASLGLDSLLALVGLLGGGGGGAGDGADGELLQLVSLAQVPRIEDEEASVRRLE